AAHHRHLIATRAAKFDELLPYAAIALARFRILYLFDDVHRVAERRVADRRGGKGDDRNLRALRKRSLDEHAGMKLAVAIIENGLHPHVSGRFIDMRFERGDLSCFDAAESVGSDLHSATDAKPSELLLRNRKLHVRRLQR